MKFYLSMIVFALLLVGCVTPMGCQSPTSIDTTPDEDGETYGGIAEDRSR